MTKNFAKIYESATFKMPQPKNQLTRIWVVIHNIQKLSSITQKFKYWITKYFLANSYVVISQSTERVYEERSTFQETSINNLDKNLKMNSYFQL